MADVTFGVKVNQELKDKLTGLMKESGLQGKDFMQNLINVYEIEKTKNSTPEIAQDIVELQYLTSRINSIYINLAHRVNNIKNSNNESYENAIKEKDHKINTLETNLKELKNKNEHTLKELNELKIENDDIKNTLSQLQDTNDSNKLLIKEYNEKLYEFSNKLNELKNHAEENMQNKKIIEELRGANENLKLSIETMQRHTKDELLKKDETINHLKKSIEFIEKEKDSLNKSLSDKFQLEKDKALLDLEVKSQEKINSLTNEYNEKIKSLLKELEDVKFKNLKNLE